GMDGMTAGTIRALLAAQHLLVFILPGIVFGFIFHKTGFWKGFDLQRLPTWLLCILGILFLVATYPLVNLSFMLNEAIPLPSWAISFEDQASDTLKSILDMHSPIIFLLNFLLIAVLPGIGEELLFRGIVQKQISGILKSPIAGIWMAAFIFSAIHMQFEGFLPRLVLGAILGYLYHWTKNLWVPMIVHAFNNGIQIFLIYTMGIDMDEFEGGNSEDLTWWLIVISIVGMYFIYLQIRKNKQPLEHS
nr:CPBP family intramembrane metalloprotease [Bacteroidota bacterium]